MAKPQQKTTEKTTALSVGGKGKLGLGKGIYSLQLSQLNRQFSLINEATKRCKANFPEDFHHKQKMAQECEDLRQRLKDGKRLLAELTKDSALSLSAEQRHQLKRFNQAISYLSFNLKGVIHCVEETAQEVQGENHGN